uniref:Uncharacterized protein n=1 Tax=Solanum tuberosum TaxID=4113 RepID=M1D7R7_SOLTU
MHTETTNKRILKCKLLEQNERERKILPSLEQELRQRLESSTSTSNFIFAELRRILTN